MNNRVFLSLGILGIIAAILAVACSGAAVEEETSMIVALRGQATAEARTLSDLPGSLEATCFSGVQLIEVKTGQVIGTAEDCLSDITPVGDGLSVTGTTFFRFQDGGTLISRGETSVHPTTIGSDAFTHITGAIPAPGSNRIPCACGGRSRAERGGARFWIEATLPSGCDWRPDHPREAGTAAAICWRSRSALRRAAAAQAERSAPAPAWAPA